MKPIALTFFLFWNGLLFAQHLGININAGLRKTFQLNKQNSLELRQQFQFNPEIKEYDNRYGDFFNEEGYWQIPDRYRDDDDGGDDDEDDDLPPGAGTGVPVNNGELNDSPYAISWEWRSTSAFQYNYRPFPWLRSNTGYGLFFNGEEFRHTFKVEADYRPLRHGKQKRKVDLAARTLFQYVGQPDDGLLEWRANLVPRMDAEWFFKKNHSLQLINSLSGRWSKGDLEFDRWRLNANLIFTYKKINRFIFGYQFQQRLDKPDNSHAVNFGYEIRF